MVQSPLRRAIVRVALLVPVLGVGLPGASAAQTTALYFDSEFGDYVGQGKQSTFTPATTTITVSRNYANGISFSVTAGPIYGWGGDFSAADNALLTVGMYTNAHRFPFTRFNALDFSGDGRACNTTGRFQILEAAYASDGSVLKLAVDFEQHCDGGPSALFGALRYNSTISTLVPFGGDYPKYQITVAPTPHGSVIADALACSVGGGPCSQTLTETQFVGIKAVADAGYQFVAWDGDCAGGGEATSVAVNGPKTCAAQFAPIVPFPRRLPFASPRTTLVVDSRTGPGDRAWDQVGQAQERRYSAVNSRVSATTAANGGFLSFTFDASDATSWTAAFRAPGTGRLAPGDYPYATRAAVYLPGPGLQFGGRCDTLFDTVNGHFTVYESTYGADGNIASFAADFEQHCDGNPVPLYGAIRFNSAVADVMPFGGAYSSFRLTVVPPIDGTISGGPVECDAFNTAIGLHCDVTLESPGSVTLQAIPDLGAVFSGWTDACEGLPNPATVPIQAAPTLCGARFLKAWLRSFGADTSLPTRFGRSITWTATASPASGVEFQFWRLDNSFWRVVQDWSPAPTYTWTPGYADIGAHGIWVRVRLAGTPDTTGDDSRRTTFSIDAGALPTITVFGPDRPAPYAARAGAITWTVAAAGGAVAPDFEFWRLDADGWHLAQSYGAGHSYTWSPQAADVGSHALQVWARNRDSLARYEVWQGLTFVVTPEAPLTVTALAANIPPAVVTTTTWTARVSGGIAPLEFEFWRYDADGWHLAQPYGASATYSWTPTTRDVGSHALQVWVRNAGSNAAYDAWTGVTFTIAPPGQPAVSITQIGPLPAAGQGSASWQATGSGGTAAREFEFWRFDAEGWHLAQTYSGTSTYTWSPGAGDAGTHAIQVWMRSVGSTAAYEAWAATGFFTIAPPPPAAVSITQIGPLPAVGKGSVTWQAYGSDSTAPREFEFWRLDVDGWHLAQTYSASSTYTWSPGFGDDGSHAIQVWMRSVGSSASYDAWAATSYFTIAP